MIKNIFWLKNINYDAVFFTLPSLLALFLIVPYFFLGTKAILYIFLFQSLLLGGPHFVLSIHYLMDRKKYLESLKKIFFIVLAISVSISFFFILRLQEQFSDYIFTGIFFLAGWHNYRQHYGLCKIYDAVMFKRTGDKSISKDSSYINVFYLLSTLTIFNYILVNPAGYIPIYKNWNVQIIYPSFLADIQIFMNILSIISFLFVLKKVIIDRLRQKKIFLLPQILIVFNTVLALYFLSLILPDDARLLNWIIPSLAHNIQYFGFVWLMKNNLSNPAEHKLKNVLAHFIRNEKLKNYLLMLLIASLISALSFLNSPEPYIFIIYALSIFHYTIDGFIWKKNYNSSVVSRIDNLSRRES